MKLVLKAKSIVVTPYKGGLEQVVLFEPDDITRALVAKLQVGDMVSHTTLIDDFDGGVVDTHESTRARTYQSRYSCLHKSHTVTLYFRAG